uniref:uncharacterized protein LOC122610240 n=1 Tax=Erigeron canadensis TaxID=72917 RepID=UPI001CB8B164|nr:uncharacterized protein LOC122610240 [Erigeron canadensis]
MNQIMLRTPQPLTQSYPLFANKENITPSSQMHHQHSPGNDNIPPTIGITQRVPLSQLQNRSTNNSSYIGNTMTQMMLSGPQPLTQSYPLSANKENITPSSQMHHQHSPNDNTSPTIDKVYPKRRIYQQRYYQQRKAMKKVVLNGGNTQTGTSNVASSSNNERLVAGEGAQFGSGNLLPLFESVATQLPSDITTLTSFTTRSSGCNTQVHEGAQEDPYDYVYQGVPTNHRVLRKPPPCRHSGAKRFKYETESFCCMKGKTKLVVTNVPAELYHPFTDQSDLGKTFRNHIRAYNTNFSFTSMGVNLDKTMANSTSGVYTFRVNGGIYHQIDQLVPRDGQPRYLQLYFYDAEAELSYRAQWSNLDKDIIRMLTRALSTNPYAQTFRSMADLGPLDNYRVTLNASVELDQRVYNRPTTSEAAGIWVEGNDNITAYKRSIVVYGKSQHGQFIQPYFGCYDPLSYPLFFPNGEAGWHNKIPRHGVDINDIVNDANDEDIDEDQDEAAEGSSRGRGRKTVSMREYYAYEFQMRPTENVLLLGGRLLQQYAVDVYIKIETSRLKFYEFNQNRIRGDQFQGLVDCFNAGEVDTSRVGQRIVLPASFIGGPRDMRRRFLDAMTLVQDDGKPDIFLTVTCNLCWDEILEDLQPGQTAQDRPDVVSRVFHAKLEDLKKQLLEKHVLGEVRAYVYIIEYQKRGLPHAHWLLIMKPQHKLTTPDQYDKLVCAEIPDPVKYPSLHEKVVRHMIHGPCGSLNPNNPCMQGEPKQCRWHYPRQFNEHTIQGDDSYPLYRRRKNGINVTVGKHNVDNRWVVPYNPRLLMMFNCHMNVEICSSIKSVKYAFKYVYKGHDKQFVHVDPDQEGVVVNEIKRFQDARYVSAPEAMWRIFRFPLFKIHPSVMALQLHLPNMQYVRFRENVSLRTTVEREQDKRSMLTAFFELNSVDRNARQYLYKEIPEHYTWNASQLRWKPREGALKRGQVVSANPAEGDRYYLRLLLTHVRGPKSFDDLYTVNGEKHSTFRKAALERGLIENDDCLTQCLTQASLFQFPNSLRRLFATILIFCEPGDVRKLWDDHYESLSEDYRRQLNNIEQVQNMVLRDISIFLQSMGKRINDFDLPGITTSSHYADDCRELQEEYSIVVEADHLCARDSLNPDQKFAFDTIMRHVDNNCPGVFFIDGPGGTGKTFLYKALLAEVRSRGEIALATASSGAAANNMPGGRTAHSRFKIPLILNNNSLCNISKQSGTAKLLRSAKIIIWDEASMAKRQAVEALDRTMQDITGIKQPFGGK